MSPRTARPISRLIAAAAAMTLGGAVLATASPASAATRNGVCETGEFCYYFNSDNQGSLSDFTGSIGDYATKQPTCYDFKGPGTGKGKCVKNAAASVWNRSGKTVRVYYNSNYAGSTYQDFAAGAKGNLTAALKNQNASHRFLSSAPPTGCKTDGTHGKLPTTILVYRKSLDRVDRVEFKTYIKDVLPNEWPSYWSTESLKAGAIAVKNFGWYWALRSASKTPSGQCYDVSDHTASQVYKPGSATAATNAAVDATWGTRMTRNGEIFKAQYCSTTTACGHWVTGDWMSQTGSRDKAQTGWDYSRILKYYYEGIVLTS
ncbi:SpoIID/LytB domain-containing protein [Streptosporangium subroseum]|uniref:SpoIID/LytB domain-containing protein n=1 Tax=Streptosporangium subroseum TaxID=106412 RepID=UPI00308FB5EA|nr:peptidase inhibitor family I36 protein [Streptosporangium subroseum]